MPQQNFNLINPDDVNVYLKKFCGENSEMEKLLMATLGKAVKRIPGFIETVTEIPQDAPEWLQKKWETQTVWHRFSPQKGTKWPQIIAQIMEKLQYAIDHKAGWLQDVNQKGIPRILPMIKTMEEANGTLIDLTNELVAKLREDARLVFVADGEEDVRTIIEFNDNFRFVRLLTHRALDRESAFLEHCIGDGNYDDDLSNSIQHFYSLRDPDNKPRMSMAVYLKDHYISQMNGKRNKPVNEYYTYIATLCHEFDLDLASYYRKKSDQYKLTSTYETELYKRSIKEKEESSSDDDILFEDAEEEIILAGNLNISYLQINNIENLKKFPDNLTIWRDATFMGTIFPENAPVNLRVDGVIKTSMDVFETVEDFLKKTYDSDGKRRL